MLLAGAERESPSFPVIFHFTLGAMAATLPMMMGENGVVQTTLSAMTVPGITILLAAPFTPEVHNALGRSLFRAMGMGTMAGIVGGIAPIGRFMFVSHGAQFGMNLAMSCFAALPPWRSASPGDRVRP